MAVSTLCKHEMSVISCALCNGAEQRAEAYRRRDVGLLPKGHLQARYAGRCAGCGEPFDRGDVIRASDDGWLAECCG